MIAQALVDHPEKVALTEVQASHCTVFELKVDKSEIGKIIGRQGRTAQAIRTILNAASAKIKKRLVLEILETNLSHRFAHAGRHDATVLQ